MKIFKRKEKMKREFNWISKYEQEQKSIKETKNDEIDY